MKILFAGVWKDGTGWSRASIDYILALDAVGVDVVPRAIKLNNQEGEVPQRILELGQKKSQGATTAIQHILPHYLSYNGKLQNIALYATETTHFRPTSWPNRLNMMDKVWVINMQSKKASLDSGVTTPITVIPHACDLTRFDKEYEALGGLKRKLSGNFSFYTIGEANKRKNLAGILKAFHSEFHPSEPVDLVVKSNKPGASPEQAASYVRDYCQTVKKGMKLYVDLGAYKDEIIVTDRMSELEIMRLHATCDSFVTASYGEAWNLPCFDAMALGKAVIAPESTGFTEYLNYDCAELITTYPMPCYGEVEHALNDMFTAHEEWEEPDVAHMREAMRMVFEDAQHRRNLGEAGRVRARDFSYDIIGNRMLEAINGRT